MSMLVVAVVTRVVVVVTMVVRVSGNGSRSEKLSGKRFTIGVIGVVNPTTVDFVSGN
jgi:hypothetical protein